jgi:hypothetical protein
VIRTVAIGFNLAAITIAAFLIGCVGPAPIQDFAISRTALEAARDSGAHQRAPNQMYSAEEKYKQGMAAYKNREYELATELFKKSIEYSEKAEFISRLNEFSTGDN